VFNKQVKKNKLINKFIVTSEDITQYSRCTKMLEKTPGYRKHPMWRSTFEDTTDSGGESQPLLSSDNNSRTSNTSYA
jgi:hypothetical protein